METAGDQPRRLLEIHETLTPADNHTHRRYRFEVPEDCRALDIQVSYAPKRLGEDQSRTLAHETLRRQRDALAERVGQTLAEQWAVNQAPQAASVRISNLVTLTLDDADGVYRGAGHRHAADQRLSIGAASASPGFVAGPLVPGAWTLTLSAHTLVSAQCEVSIQIGAEMASSL